MAALAAPFPRILQGLEPDKYSTNVLNINGDGAWADASGQYLFTYQQNGTPLQIDMMTVGLNGRDATYGLGSNPPPNGSDWYLYAVGNPSTGANGFVLSRSIGYGTLSLPAGYTARRKLPFGFIYNASWDGIPNFHFPALGWGGLITLTDAHYAGPSTALWKGRSSTWANIDLSGVLPDNARVAWIGTEVRDAGLVQDGNAWIRTYSGQGDDGILCGGSSGVQTAISSFDHHFIRVTSDRKIQYKTVGGSCLIVNVEGYLMTEPS